MVSSATKLLSEKDLPVPSICVQSTGPFLSLSIFELQLCDYYYRNAFELARAFDSMKLIEFKCIHYILTIQQIMVNNILFAILKYNYYK